jgi:hypothetical protein
LSEIDERRRLSKLASVGCGSAEGDMKTTFSTFAQTHWMYASININKMMEFIGVEDVLIFIWWITDD